MSRWIYYAVLGWRDLTRLWSTTQHHIIIVTGICLPILLLLGLKRGHVESLRRDLVTSPTGRQVTFWSAREGALMNRKSVDLLTQQLPNVQLIIPETQRVVGLRSLVDGINRKVDSITMFPSRNGDPLLGQFRIPVPKEGSKEIVIGKAVSDQLGLRVGEEIEVVVSRGKGSTFEEATVMCQLIGIVPTQEAGASIGYADLDLIDSFESFARGYRVDALGWASAKSPAADTYSSYLVFCESGNDLTEEDLSYLKERGFRIGPKNEGLPPDLTRLLRDKWENDLIVREIATGSSKENLNDQLRIAPSQLSESTTADDVVVPWNLPLKNDSGSVETTLIGLSMAKRSWLREFFKNPAIPFHYESDSRSCKFSGPSDLKSAEVRLASQSKAVRLQRDIGENSAEEDSRDEVSPAAGDDPQAIPEGIMIVPADLLSWLHQERSGLVVFDEDVQLFVAKPQPAIYDRARLYANTIDDVPTVVAALSEQNFAVMSETGRITEIQEQDASLELLVWVVGVGVFFFGIITVFSVLKDATDRKRGTIGILRVMGVSRTGVFMTVLLRSAVIGLAAALFSVVLGIGLSQFLGWVPAGSPTWLQSKPVVQVLIDSFDLLLVSMGAIACCCLGAIPSAWKASRLDPFDAIIEGRFQ